MYAKISLYLQDCKVYWLLDNLTHINTDSVSKSAKILQEIELFCSNRGTIKIDATLNFKKSVYSLNEQLSEKN